MVTLLGAGRSSQAAEEEDGQRRGYCFLFYNPILDYQPDGVKFDQTWRIFLKSDICHRSRYDKRVSIV